LPVEPQNRRRRAGSYLRVEVRQEPPVLSDLLLLLKYLEASAYLRYPARDLLPNGGYTNPRITW
jgi:hypothetical protein